MPPHVLKQRDFITQQPLSWTVFSMSVWQVRIFTLAWHAPLPHALNHIFQSHSEKHFKGSKTAIKVPYLYFVLDVSFINQLLSAFHRRTIHHLHACFMLDICCITSHNVDGKQSWWTGSKWKCLKRWSDWLQLMITCSGKHELTLNGSDQDWYANTCHPLWCFHDGNFRTETSFQSSRRRLCMDKHDLWLCTETLLSYHLLQM